MIDSGRKLYKNNCCQQREARSSKLIMCGSLRTVNFNRIRMKKPVSYLLVLILLFSFSCKPKPKEKDTFAPSFSTYNADTSNSAEPVVKNEIFYGVLTPIEITRFVAIFCYKIPHYISWPYPIFKSTIGI